MTDAIDIIRRHDEALREYAKGLGGDAARAAQDGYDVRHQVIKALLDKLPGKLRTVWGEDARSPRLSSLEVRSAPSGTAFAKLDRVTESVATLGPELAGLGVNIEVGRISRAQLQIDDGLWLKYTVIPARLSAPWLVQPVLILFDAEKER